MTVFSLLSGRVIGGVLLLGACVGAAAAAGIQTRTLPNGLKVIVKEDHRAPVVVSMVWYRAGGMDEISGTTGVAHVLEHMMFKGTQQVPAGEFSKIIAAAGGRDNAFTSKDYTAYFQQLQKSRLPLAFKLEADRMRNLRLTDEEFKKEIKVVMEERRWRTDDQPRALLYERLLATAFLAHPYRAPVIGWMGDLQNMQPADARDWYRKWYAPNNASLVIVGDVRAEDVFALARRHFGPIPPRTLPERRPQQEPAQLGIRRITVRAPAQLPYLMMAYRVPSLQDPARDWEPYALEVLVGILDGSDAARLQRELLRRERLATSVGASYDSISRGPGLLMLDGSPVEGRTVEELEAALRSQIQRIIQEGVDPAELERVKTQLRAAQVFERDSMFYQAMQIGQLVSAGLPPDSQDVMLGKLQAVTAEQVQAVAKKYFRDDQLTVGVLQPLPLPRPPAPASAPGGRHGS